MLLLLIFLFYFIISWSELNIEVKSKWRKKTAELGGGSHRRGRPPPPRSRGGLKQAIQDFDDGGCLHGIEPCKMRSQHEFQLIGYGYGLFPDATEIWSSHNHTLGLQVDTVPQSTLSLLPLLSDVLEVADRKKRKKLINNDNSSGQSSSISSYFLMASSSDPPIL